MTTTAPVRATTRGGGSTTRRTLAAVRTYLVLAVAGVLFVSPVYYLVVGSLKPAGRVLDGIAGFAPTDLTLGNYRKVFDSLSSDSTGHFLQFMGNSLVISALIVVGGLVVNSMAAYSLARLDWRGSGGVLLVVVALVIVPFESVAVPLLYLLQGQRNTLLIQVVPFVANAFSIYLFYTFFLSLPKSVEEAARMDGLGAFGTFRRIVVPNSRPVFATVTILTFMSSWGQFLWPLLTVSDPAVRPLPLELSVFSGQQPVDWGSVFAFGVLLVAPILVVFFAFQRYFVQSVAGSAVKG